MDDQLEEGLDVVGKGVDVLTRNPAAV
jgi:hypothetical protein